MERIHKNLEKCGPDCCFLSSKDSVFFGKNNFKIDEDFCDLLKKGKLFKGKKLDVNLIDVNSPIPNARGNHLVLKGKNATDMVKKLRELG